MWRPRSLPLRFGPRVRDRWALFCREFGSRRLQHARTTFGAVAGFAPSSLVLPASVSWLGAAGCGRAGLSEAHTARARDGTSGLSCAPMAAIGPSDYRGRFQRWSRGDARPALGGSHAARALPAHEAADAAPHQPSPRRTPAVPVRAGRGDRRPAPDASVAESAVPLAGAPSQRHHACAVGALARRKRALQRVHTQLAPCVDGLDRRCSLAHPCARETASCQAPRAGAPGAPGALPLATRARTRRRVLE